MPFEATARNYLAERPLNRIDLNYRKIHNFAPYHEAFTEKAKQYYTGVYLTHIVKAYAAVPPEPDDLAIEHFLFYITRPNARKLPFNQKQSTAIANVLEFVADKMDLEYASEEDVEALLNAIQYWRGRSA